MTLLNTRTNIVLDDSLIERAMQKANVHTKREAVDAALKAFVREPDWGFALSLRGSNLVANDYDPIDAPGDTVIQAKTVTSEHPRVRAISPNARAKAKRQLAIA
jgi:Bacterial antitoxin of type II TA system, VapB